ncbi:amidohydrolase family protein [soil metagenome]
MTDLLKNDEKLAHRETALEPDLAIIDPHHHLWTTQAHSMATYYPAEQLITDTREGGHNVVATVFLECTSHYRTTGPAELLPVGETEFVVAQDVPAGLMAGIVGYADVRLGAGVGEVLEAHREAGGERFKGIRYSTAWDASPEVTNTARDAPPGTLVTPAFMRGVQEVGDHGFVFETWEYFHQLGEVLELSRATPNTQIIVDHLGGPAGVGPYADHREEMLEHWRSGMSALAGQENIVVKLGGIGFSPYIQPQKADSLTSSDAIAEYWGPEIRFCVETFGADRCMFESNYPVDSSLCDYVTLWNSFKRMTVDYSPAERESLFAGTARRVYSLEF